MGNFICPGQCCVRSRPRRATERQVSNSHTQSHPTPADPRPPIPLVTSNIQPLPSEVMVFVAPGVKRPLSQLTEEEQIQICIRLGLIDSFPQSIYDDSKRDKFSECVICLTDYADGDKLRVLPCLHAFHRECIDDWLQRSFTCPSCQQDLLQQLATQSPPASLTIEKFLNNAEQRSNIAILSDAASATMNTAGVIRLTRRASGHPTRQRSGRRQIVIRSKSFSSLGASNSAVIQPEQPSSSALHRDDPI